MQRRERHSDLPWVVLVRPPNRRLHVFGTLLALSCSEC
ncbi:hypothetical protein Rumeso_02088 [Rubellimicrobium mesophilum DSM 19309]|uniref:Uncharacterized protein n=1 Tax=Rubellimicrobium mesophilum DSM 19309 TaxID=442562 RepID=A0A017HPT3_9RHOB|nr:hypothetical protein Rumeso_02088 [Rubellimicrobium mesophilum DSM 19309]